MTGSLPCHARPSHPHLALSLSCPPQLEPERLGVSVPAGVQPGDLLDVVVPRPPGPARPGPAADGQPRKVRVVVPGRLGPGRSLEVDVWTARLGP